MVVGESTMNHDEMNVGIYTSYGSDVCLNVCYLLGEHVIW